MKPRLRRFDKALEKQRAGDRAGERTRRRIVDVRDLGIEHGVVRRPQRHAPQRIVLFRSVTQHVGRDSLVVGVERHKLRPDRDARRPCQGAHVDQKVRRFLVRDGQRISENEPAFRIGIADLDRQALARRIDIERTKRIPRDRVLDRRDQHAAAAP